MKFSSITIILVVLLIILAFPAAGLRADTASDNTVLFGEDRPGGAWYGITPKPPAASFERTWQLRTGFKKGIYDLLLNEEKTAAPDIAVLHTGFFAEWQGVLSSFSESFVLAEPHDIALLADTKPLLIIPSGGFAGLASSDFFRAGVAEYVRSGGIVLCFAQQKGEDFLALPAPESESSIHAVGWTEDSGALFRASSVQISHPVLTGVNRTTPSIETDGYFVSYPADAKVLLSRPDGFPTFILYPFGAGWVAATAMFSDVSFGQGLLHDEERSMIQNIILWAKSRGRITELFAGKQFKTILTIHGPEEGEASFIRIAAVNPASDKPRDERTLQFEAKNSLTSSLTYSYWVPADAKQGIYRIEYALLDAKKQQITPWSETEEGWFAVMPRSAQTVKTGRGNQPLAPFPVKLTATPFIETSSDRTLLTIEISGASVPSVGYDLIVRTANQEKSLRLAQAKSHVTFELPKLISAPVSFAVYHSSGRVIAKGAAAPFRENKIGVTADRPWYGSKDKVRVSVAGMGLGALTISGLGLEQSEHISKDKSFEFSIPESLPSGVYPINWEFRTRDGAIQQGIIHAPVDGTKVKCLGALFQHEKDKASAVLMISSTGSLKAVIKLRLMDPNGVNVLWDKREVSLSKGTQKISFAGTFRPEISGIWQLQYEILVQLPEGPGFASEPVELSSGKTAIDIGPVAVLGMRTNLPVYYESAEKIDISAIIFARSRTVFELALDGKKTKKEKIEKPGILFLTTKLDRPAQGPHTAIATAASEGYKTSRQISFISGARLPDLAPHIRTADIKGPMLEVGVGIINNGKSAAGHVHAYLYEGDPEHGGTLIQSFVVPPLTPGKQHVVIVPWSLVHKAGNRTLTAVVDQENKTIEISKSNNKTSATITVPDILVTVIPQKETFTADERIAYQVRITNLTSTTFPVLNLNIQAADNSGATIISENIPLANFAPGDDRVLDKTLNLTTLEEGTYIIAAQVSSAAYAVAADSAGVAVLPTLLLKGSLEGTPASAALCRPFTIRYSAKNAGNVPPFNGTLKIEIRSKDSDLIVFARQLPFELKSASLTIDRVELPRGNYVILLKGQAVNPARGMERDFLLDQRSLTVAGPVEVTRSEAAVPRILIWTGGENATNIEQALIEKIIKEAFDEEGVYHHTVSTAEAFTNQALTGIYTSYVLIEPAEIGNAIDAITHELTAGKGVIIAGSGEHSRAIGEAFGFRFGKPVAGGTVVSFPFGTPLGLTGSIPVFGQALSPSKKGAQSVAVFSNGQPAILTASVERGKVLVVPFSLTEASLNSGSTMPYSLLVRSAVRAAEPEKNEMERFGSVRLEISSSYGPVKTRITESLPAGAKLFWANKKSSTQSGPLVFDIIADSEPRTIQYLYEKSKDGDTPTGEVFFDCNGSFISQGKMN